MTESTHTNPPDLTFHRPTPEELAADQASVDRGLARLYLAIRNVQGRVARLLDEPVTGWQHDPVHDGRSCDAIQDLNGYAWQLTRDLGMVRSHLTAGARKLIDQVRTDPSVLEDPEDELEDGDDQEDTDTPADVPLFPLLGVPAVQTPPAGVEYSMLVGEPRQLFDRAMVQLAQALESVAAHADDLLAIGGPGFTPGAGEFSVRWSEVHLEIQAAKWFGESMGDMIRNDMSPAATRLWERERGDADESEDVAEQPTPAAQRVEVAGQQVVLGNPGATEGEQFAEALANVLGCLEGARAWALQAIEHEDGAAAVDVDWGEIADQVANVEFWSDLIHSTIESHLSVRHDLGGQVALLSRDLASKVQFVASARRMSPVDYLAALLGESRLDADHFEALRRRGEETMREMEEEDAREAARAGR